ncbi:copper transporter [Corynebacterium sp.]|uniref:copper transporter n=1 Tax=Corynebacterium sp. TaxID=1720 RepID=UPI0025C60A4F|nr:copper transporter [Corynebacterium sp.]
MGAGKTTGVVALGIAVGTAVGFYVLAPNVEGGPAAVDSEAQSRLTAETDRADLATAEGEVSDAVLGDLAADAVGDSLRDRSVLVMATDDADEEAVDGVRALIGDAGGEDAGTLRFDPSFTSPESGDELKSLAAGSLPSGASLSEDRLDPGYHVGELLGQSLSGGRGAASESDRAVVLGALGNAGFFAGGQDDLTPADAVVVVTGGASEGDGDGNYSTRFVADLAAGLDATTGGVVLAGEHGAAGRDGAIGLVRADADATENVSTVDNVTSVAGRITVVRAVAGQLDGDAGAYGSASNAAAPTVE